MSIKILVNGAFGRMGQMTVKALASQQGFEVVGQTGREYHLEKAIKDSGAQVVVDFTHPDSVFTNTNTIIEAGAHPVIGTTGLSTEQIAQLKEQCAAQQLGGLIVPNFSLGAVLMMKFAKEMVKYMPQVEIVEMHHDKKVDSPSGTAMRSAEILAESRHSAACQQLSINHFETIAGARGATYCGIPIHAVRLPGFLSQQEIIFGDVGETLTLKHVSIDRECFMPGIRLACERVMTLNRLVYGLEEIL